MKKIVGILSAAAVLAASVFAADVSAAVGVSSTLFKSDTDGYVDVLGTLNNNKTADYATLFSLQFSSDVAGGGVKYWGDNTDSKVKFGSYNVWFKPMDGLKLSFRENGLGLFADKFNGYEAWGVAGVSAGYGVEYAINGLTFNLNIKDGFAGKKDRNADTYINEFGVKAAYAADFGNVALVAAINNGKDKEDKDKRFNSFQIGAGYSGKIADVVDLVGTVGFKYNDNKSNKILATVSAGGNIDAFGWAVCVPARVAFETYPKETKYGDETSKTINPAEVNIGLQASASYKINSIGLKAYFKSNDLLANTVNAEKSEEKTAEANKNWKPGDDIKNVKVRDYYFAGNFGVEVTGNVGAASWKVTPDLAITTQKDAKKTTFSISFETGFAF